MQITIRAHTPQDMKQMAEIWNTVVRKGDAFPQLETLNEHTAAAFFDEQSFAGVAESAGRLLGLYILHPNNIGRCGHLANASYAVSAGARGQGIGEKLVLHSMETARSLGFRVLQFNAVVKANAAAVHLYRKLGFIQLGTVPGGFLDKDGCYQDIVLFYHPL